MRTHQVRIMNKKEIFAAATVFLLISVAALPVQAALPENFDFNDNYYTVYGGPDLSATLLGDNEFSRGDTVTLSIEMTNKGVISGFKSEKDVDIGEYTDEVLQETEKEYEAQAVTAIGILAALSSDDPNIKVKSGAQEAGTLKQGKKSTSPLKFTIEINKNASAGTYPLTLEMSYKYQSNVQVGGDDYDSATGLVTNSEVGLWYQNNTQIKALEIKVKKEPYFEVTNVSGDLYPDKGGMLYVTYKNTGEDPAKDATVRVSPGDPFSTTDDQAYLGTLNPGESTVAIFDMDVDEDATPKIYSISSEILYEDTDGHDQISDSVKINTEVLPSEAGLPGFQLGSGIIFMGLAACFMLVRKKQGK
jgi:hypothetical protein